MNNQPRLIVRLAGYCQLRAHYQLTNSDAVVTGRGVFQPQTQSGSKRTVNPQTCKNYPHLSPDCGCLVRLEPLVDLTSKILLSCHLRMNLRRTQIKLVVEGPLIWRRNRVLEMDILSPWAE